MYTVHTLLGSSTKGDTNIEQSGLVLRDPLFARQLAHCANSRLVYCYLSKSEYDWNSVWPKQHLNFIKLIGA